MTKKEKDETAESKKKADAENNGEGEHSEEEEEPVEKAEEEAEGEEGDSSLKEDEPDYEVLAEEERKRDEEARKAAADKAFQDREARRKGGKDGKKKDKETDEDEEDDNAPLTRKDLADILARDRAEGRKEVQESQALQIARANTSSEAEAKAAVTFWKTRVTPTGDLSEDVLFAIAGMNRKRTAVKISEVARANKGKENTSRNVAGTHRDGAEAPGPKLSANDASAIKAAGMVWDGARAVYKKPLNGGKKHLYYDPKSKKRWTAQ